MEWYIQFVTSQPILSAMIQFGLLGFLGEFTSIMITGATRFPFTVKQTILKILAWAILGITIKYAFKGFAFFVHGLAMHGMLPAAMIDPSATAMLGMGNSLWNVLGFAFGVSVFMNILFGPQMMFFHRVMDNLIDSSPGNWKGMDTALRSLLWFWIPAHTVTFCLPSDYRIGLAALWSVMLGIIMGFAKAKKAIAAHAA